MERNDEFVAARIERSYIQKREWYSHQCIATEKEETTKTKLLKALWKDQILDIIAIAIEWLWKDVPKKSNGVLNKTNSWPYFYVSHTCYNKFICYVSISYGGRWKCLKYLISLCVGECYMYLDLCNKKGIFL